MTADNQNKSRGQHNDTRANADSNIVGRVDNSGNEQFKEAEREADISHVDRQEGTMNNGTLGGNFDKEEA